MNKPWVLILGANSDIAMAVSHKFAKNGYSIYLASRNIALLDKAASDIRIRYDVGVEVLSFDALDYSMHQSFYENLSPKPEGVILTFGILGEQKESESDFKLAKGVIDTNYTSTVSILEIIAGDFEKRKSGFIVGISSVAGDRGRASNYIYGSAKAGFTAYLSGLRHRLHRSSVNVLTVKPGFVDTKMTMGMDLPKKLTASPQEVANSIYNGVLHKRGTVYVRAIWRYIMLIIRCIPEFLFKKTSL